jgi:hypothetical protein
MLQRPGSAKHAFEAIADTPQIRGARQLQPYLEVNNFELTVNSVRQPASFPLR